MTIKTSIYSDELQTQLVDVCVTCILSRCSHLLGEAHNLQSVTLPNWSIGASVHQLIHRLHRFDGGDLGSKT